MSLYWTKRWWVGSGISWTICKSLASRSRQITMPAPHHSVVYGLDALSDAQPTVLWRQIQLITLHYLCDDQPAKEASQHWGCNTACYSSSNYWWPFFVHSKWCTWYTREILGIGWYDYLWNADFVYLCLQYSCLECFDRKSICPVKTEWWGVGVVICLDRGANDLHMVQLMPLPPYHFLLHSNTNWFYFSGAGLPRLSWKRGR